jgi:hypothetical protein
VTLRRRNRLEGPCPGDRPQDVPRKDLSHGLEPASATESTASTLGLPAVTLVSKGHDRGTGPGTCPGGTAEVLA